LPVVVSEVCVVWVDVSVVVVFSDPEFAEESDAVVDTSAGGVVLVDCFTIAFPMRIVFW
jgi:hypothetical protein